MKVTQRVRKILSNYESDTPGTKAIDFSAIKVPLSATGTSEARADVIRYPGTSMTVTAI